MDSGVLGMGIAREVWSQHRMDDGVVFFLCMFVCFPKDEVVMRFLDGSCLLYRRYFLLFPTCAL